MKLFSQVWNNFKTQPHVWFFYGFLLTFTLSVRKVLKFYPIGGLFNEYSGIYLYLSDIFLILAIFLWGYSILCNNKYNLSNIAARFITRIKNVPRGTFLLLPLILVFWSFTSLIWADNKIVALFRSFKLAEFYLLFLYIIYNVPRGTFLKRSSKIIIALGCFQAIFGIWQFIIQHSIGLFWLKESLISPDVDGVAKIVVSGEKFIRAYGLFPHSNILGCFLLISITLTLTYEKLFRHDSNVPRLPRENKMFHVEHFIFLRSGTITRTILAIQIIALILTFSKSAIIGLCIAIIYALWKNNKLFHACPVTSRCSTWNILKFFGVEQFGRKAFLTIGIILMLLIIAKPDTNPLLFKSLNERLFYINVSRGTILSNPIIGVGSGQFVIEMDKYATHLSADSADGTILAPWQYQPVHNVFLLIWSELGFVGLFIFIWFLWRMFHVEQIISKSNIECSTWNNDSCIVYKPVHTENVPRGTFLLQQETLKIFKGALWGLLFIMLFDHYLWDIQQGQIMLWLVLGLLAGSAIIKK